MNFQFELSRQGIILVSKLGLNMLFKHIGLDLLFRRR